MNYAALFLMVRKEKKWVQCELARNVGISQSCVSKIEAGLAPPNADMIIWFLFQEPGVFYRWARDQSPEIVAIRHQQPVRLVREG